MAEGATPRRVVRFGVFEADLEAGELRKQGRRLGLQDQPFRILALLLDRPLQVVTRDEICAALWPAGTFVDFDHGLNKAMNRLRDALGDSADTPRFIETIPKRGYRFIAPIEEVSATKGDFAQPAESVELPPARVRVMPRATLWIVMAVGLAALAVTSAVLYLRQPHALTEGDTLVLADFDNRTGDGAFDHALKQAMSIALQDSRRLATVSDQRVADTLRLMRRDPNERLTPELARDVSAHWQQGGARRLYRKPRQPLCDWPGRDELSDW
jgi:eukaryotic-like serine/threonine-protein kinase